MAESVFRHLVAERGLASHIQIDSAGTGSWHVGHPPHPETQQELERNRIDVGSGRARQVTPRDLTAFDYVVAMDTSNLADLQDLATTTTSVTCAMSRLLEHARGADVVDVPDPYYAGGYDHVFSLVMDGCIGLLEHIIARHQLPEPAGP